MIVQILAREPAVGETIEDKSHRALEVGKEPGGAGRGNVFRRGNAGHGTLLQISSGGWQPPDYDIITRIDIYNALKWHLYSYSSQRRHKHGGGE